MRVFKCPKCNNINMFMYDIKDNTPRKTVDIKFLECCTCDFRIDGFGMIYASGYNDGLLEGKK